MTKLEKTFIALLLLSYLLYLTFKNFQVNPGFQYSYLVILTAISGFTLNIYYLARLRFSFYWILILFFLSEWTALIFKPFHLAGADIIIIFWYLLLAIIGLTLSLTGLSRIKKFGVKSLYRLIVGAVLLAQLTLTMVTKSSHSYLQLTGHYILIATIMTMKLKKVEINRNESYLMTLLLLSLVIIVLSELVI